MSLRKLCSPDSTFADGRPNPLYCSTSPRCDHHWHYDFRVNRHRYRNTTETADKQKAKDIEARERARILEGRHGIRRQPDITFKSFTETYLRDHAELHKRSVDRDREMIKTLNRSFGSLILHEITAHRVEQWKLERLGGKWRGHNYKSAPKPLKPATVNRELDLLKSILSKAVEWGKLLANPARGAKRFKVDNRRLRILSEDEQRRLLEACPRKLQAIVGLALITTARIGELLALTWEQCTDGYLTFLETKNGKARRLPISADVRSILDAQPRIYPWVFTNAKRRQPYTVNGAAHVFDRAVERAGIANPAEVTLHTLRHTAISRMIAAGYDDYTVMEICGHSDTRMLARYTHPTEERKVAALELPSVVNIWSTSDAADENLTAPPAELAELLGNLGGRQEARTPDLRVANTA